MIVDKILQSLTYDFENVVCANEKLRNLEEVAMDISRLLLKYMNNRRRKRNKES